MPPQTVQKEEFMRGLKDFLRESVPAMVDYILVVSTPSDIYASPSSTGDAGRHERLGIMKAMRERQMGSSRSKLDSEAIPVLPHLLDMPRHLAIITSAVIRNSREFMASPPSEDDRPLRQFCSKCFEVEGLALQRVSHIASSIAGQQPYPSENWQSSTLPTTASSNSTPQQPQPQSGRKSSRPSTAPSPIDSSFRSLPPDLDMTAPLSPNNKGSQRRLRHLKSTSTDSIPTRENFSPGSILRPDDLSPDLYDDRKARKGLLRNILRR